MPLKNKYAITKKYITNSTNRPRRNRRGNRFGVAHETANNTADATAHYRYFQNHDVYASYHQLVDSTQILEIIPSDEEAYHVQRQRDKQTLGLGVSNHYAMAISICRTGDFNEAYDRFVWAWAKWCVDTNKNPKKDITAHAFEDPGRRSDPQSWLEPNGVTWNQFLNDVDKYVKAWNSDVSIERYTASKDRVPSGNEDVLKKGDNSELVRQLQLYLLEAGERLPRYGPDGDFGNETEVAVKALQARHGLTVDGIAGPMTFNKLREVLTMSKHFDDTDGHWAESEIDWAKEKGFIDGFPDGSYRPDDPLTRAQIAVILKNYDDNK